MMHHYINFIKTNVDILVHIRHAEVVALLEKEES